MALGPHIEPPGPHGYLTGATLGTDDRRVRAAAWSVAERISLSEDRLAEAGAELFPLAEGRVIRQASFPHVYDANLVRRARLREESLDLALERLAAPLRAVGARHLQLALDGADVPKRVEPLLIERGFTRDRLIAMTLFGSPLGRPAEGVSLRRVPDESPWDAFAYAMDRLNRDEAWYAPSVSREIVGSMRAKKEAGAVSLYVAEAAGRVVGTVGLSLDHHVASIFSVGALPEARGRGVGRTLVLGAVERAQRARADFVYLIARAADTPREMYRKLGFRAELDVDVWLRLPR